jgi:hypothetical protein
MRLSARLPVLALLGSLTGACATIPEAAGGDEGLPNAGAGPFRALTSAELGNNRSGPNGLTDSRGFARDVAVVDLDGKPDTFDVAAFVAVAVKENGVDPTPASPTGAIQRFGAVDGRSFDRAALVVLTPDAAWEGGVLASPAVVRAGSELFLYYGAAGGIGLARGGADGMSFTKVSGPVLGPSAGGWEAATTPRSPGVVKLADGSFRMFYEVPLPSGSVLGEARSSDGVSWERMGSGPALGGATRVDDAGDVPYDAGGVGSPFPMLATSADGREILRVYYGATDSMGTKTIGLAARYGTEGALQRGVAPVFGTGKPLGPGEPCVVAFSGFSLLYATELSSTSDKDPAVAVGVAPATAVLPPPMPR